MKKKILMLVLVLVILPGICRAGEREELKLNCTDCIASPSLGDYLDCAKYASSKDEYGLNPMLQSGRCLRLEWGSHLLFLENLGEVAQVRVLDGKYKNQAVWMSWAVVVHGTTSNWNIAPTKSKRR